MERKRQEAPGSLELVRRFVNTADLAAGEDELSSGAALSRWLAGQRLIGDGTRAGRQDVRSAVQLREALRAILLAQAEGTPAPAQAWGIVDQVSARARLRLRFSPSGQPALEPDARGVEAGLGRLLALVHGAIADGTWKRLKACREDTCQWAFYDHTKNRSGSWCTMQVCGNRAKARAYRERRRPG